MYGGDVINEWHNYSRSYYTLVGHYVIDIVWRVWYHPESPQGSRVISQPSRKISGIFNKIFCRGANDFAWLWWCTNKRHQIYLLFKDGLPFSLAHSQPCKLIVLCPVFPPVAEVLKIGHEDIIPGIPTWTSNKFLGIQAFGTTTLLTHQMTQSFTQRLRIHKFSNFINLYNPTVGINCLRYHTSPHQVQAIDTSARKATQVITN